MTDDMEHDEWDECELDFDEVVNSRVEQAQRLLLRALPRKAEWVLNEAEIEARHVEEGLKIAWWETYLRCAVQRGASAGTIQGRARWVERLKRDFIG